MPCFETAGHTAGHCKHKTLGKTPVKQLLTVFTERFVPCNDGEVVASHGCWFPDC